MTLPQHLNLYWFSAPLVVAATNTYFFGSGGGKDTINFGQQIGQKRNWNNGLTIAIDSSYGATSGMTFTKSTSLITFGRWRHQNFVINHWYHR